jgi:predicted nucleic acid binding AN1-type Zn finger protein
MYDTSKKLSKKSNYQSNRPSPIFLNFKMSLAVRKKLKDKTAGSPVKHLFLPSSTPLNKTNHITLSFILSIFAKV